MLESSRHLAALYPCSDLCFIFEGYNFVIKGTKIRLQQGIRIEVIDAERIEAMDWNTLISVVIGGLIATIGSILNNRFQAQERQKDREEQRRESKIQAREKWTERDILRIMDLLESLMKLLAEDKNLEWEQVILEDKKTAGVITQKEYMKAGGMLFVRIPERIQENANTLELMARLVYSFEKGDMVSSYEKFADAVQSWNSFDREGAHPHTENKKRQQKGRRLWFDVNIAAGEFRRALREELISIRNM